MQKILSISFLILLGINFSLKADTATLSVDVDKPGIRISPMLYGLMTEEINHSYDGGLYAELIQNRIFKDPTVKGRPNMPHWSVVNNGRIALDDTNPVNTVALTTSLRLDIPTLANGQRAGVSNDGFWGIPALPNTRYTASFYARANETFSGPLTLSIETNNDSTVLASATVPAITTSWKQYTVTLETKDLTPSATNHFVISATSPGSVWFNLVSLFPPTYNDRPNGNRIDLMQKLADMHPAFLRLPGGNYLEGDHVAQRLRLAENNRQPRPAARTSGTLELSFVRRHGASGIPRMVRRPEDAANPGRLCRLLPAAGSRRARPLSATVRPGRSGRNRIRHRRRIHDLGQSARRQRSSRPLQNSLTSRSATKIGSTIPSPMTTDMHSSTTPSKPNIRISN